MTTTDESRSSKQGWRRTTVFARYGAVKAAELSEQPGVCAGCRKPFRDHADEALRACAATFEDTLPDEASV
jgi:hypothetical protein